MLHMDDDDHSMIHVFQTCAKLAAFSASFKFFGYFEDSSNVPSARLNQPYLFTTWTPLGGTLYLVGTIPTNNAFTILTSEPQASSNYFAY